MLRRSAPIMTLSLANSSSCMPILFLSRLAASRAASLTRFSRSAPLKPGVPRAIMARLTPSSNGVLREWTLRISSRPRISGARHDHLTVEPARSEQRRIEDIGAVGGGNQNDAFIGFESVHLHQELVQGLFAFVMTATQSGPAMAADGVDFIDKDDARRVFLALHKQIAYARSAHAHEHLHKVGAADGEKGNPGFAGDGPRQTASCRCPARP